MKQPLLNIEFERAWRHPQVGMAWLTIYIVTEEMEKMQNIATTYRATMG